MQGLEQPTLTITSAKPPGGAQSVIECILRQRTNSPDAIALVCGNRSISYHALMARVERWASGLRRLKVGPESVVGIHLEKADERVTAILAVLRAGGAYLPFDHGHPRSRCCDILRASAAAAVISDEADLGACARLLTPRALDANSETDELPLPDERQLAYVIYTSGSTGAPKGVAIEHAALLNHMQWMITEFGKKTAARVIQRTSCMFDASVWEFFLSLMTGGTLILHEANSNDPQVLRTMLIRETVTAMQCVPTYLRLAFESGVFDDTSLNIIFVGGEALGANLASAVRNQTNASVVNLYGPTETTVDAAFFDASDLSTTGESCPIGRAITNIWARSMKPDYDPAPEKTPAELWIGGAGVGRGYHRAAALTACAFVPDPFTDKPGRRAYRTGDLVREEKGLLTFVSRADRLLKLKGFRVEPDEIEAALRQHALIRDAVVLVRNNRDTQILVAYCLRSPNQNPDNEAVRSYLKERLPHYMVPAQFVWLDSFPVKSNGKLDVSALPEPEIITSEDAPQTALERTLAGIYSKLFKRQVSVSNNFFDLGGDSIRSIQVISLAKQQGLHLRLQDIFECPTIRELASRVTQSSEAGPARTPFELVPKQDHPLLDQKILEDAYPTSVMLDALYFLNETSPKYEIYVTSCELQAVWEPEAFRSALARTVERHTWLRTSFAFEGFSRPLQLVHKQVPIRWNFKDASHLPPPEQELFLLQWIDLEKTIKFDWREVPVWRIAIHQWAGDRFQITLSEPVFDGWSVSSFLGELITNYAAFQNGMPGQPRPKPRAFYRDFIVAEQQALQDATSTEFWKQMTARNAGRALPRWSRQPLEDRGGLRLEMRFSTEVSNSLREIARRASAPLKSVLLAVHARVIGALTGRPRVISGVIMNGRSEGTDTEQVLGLHINTAPLVLDLTASNWLKLIQQVFEIEKSALPHRRYPMAAIQKMHGRTSLFEAAFNFTHFHGLGEYVRASGLKMLRYLALDQTFFPLTAQFHVDVNDATVGLGLDYDSTEFPIEQIEEIASLYRNAIDQLIAAPEQSFKRILQETRSPAAPEIDSQLTHEAVLESFRRVVEERPDQIALITGQHQISYAKLADGASSLAARLRKYGVTGQSVLVCFGNQGPALIALLALMEAGGIYVPVDPEFPAARIAQIARNASATLCLCEDTAQKRLHECGLMTWTLDIPELLRSTSQHNRDYSRVPPGPAYRIYTSGSTGTPKGVEVGPEALQHFLWAMRSSIELTAIDIVSGITTISFDISLLEMLLPITTGARLVALDRETCRDGARLAESLRSSEVTCCQATPTTWRMLLEANADLPSGLKAISGGEALAADVAERLLACKVELTNAYGPTETTIWSAAGIVRSAKAITLGPPLGATTLRVTDAFFDDCLPGVIGEIQIGGAGIANGYVRNPALTAERFIPSVSGRGERCYRTGDLGRRAANGAIEFLGRMDQQVKLRGYRIEIGEIEEALRGCPGVRNAAVGLVGEDRLNLAGYVVLDANGTWDEGQIKNRLRNLLPEYMVPRYFVIMDSLPLTANQKLDRSRLPAPNPASQNGRRITEIFEQVKAMRAEDVRRALANHL